MRNTILVKDIDIFDLDKHIKALRFVINSFSQNIEEYSGDAESLYFALVSPLEQVERLVEKIENNNGAPNL